MKHPFNFSRLLPTRKPLEIHTDYKPTRRASESSLVTLALEEEVEDTFGCLVDSLEIYVAKREAKLMVFDGDCCCMITFFDGMNLSITVEDLFIGIHTNVSLSQPLSNFRVEQLEEKEMVHVDYTRGSKKASLAQYLMADDFLVDDEEVLHNSLDNFVLVASEVSKNHQAVASQERTLRSGKSTEKNKNNRRQQRRRSI